MDAEVIIVGAGPVGSLAAIDISKAKKDVLIIDQRKVVGIPEHCAGLLSKNGLELLGIHSLPKSVIQNSNIIGAKFISPSNKEFIIRRKNTQAIVVDRILFDQYLLELAKKNGTEIITEAKIINAHFTKDKNTSFQLKDKKQFQTMKTLHSFLGVIAEGSSGLITKQVLNKAVSTKNRYSGYQYLIENIHDLDKELVELFVDNSIAPDFFTWIIPINDTTAKVGLASREKKAPQRLRYLMQKHPNFSERFKKSTIIKSFGGEVIVNGLLSRASTDGFMVIGDAAGQTKATTGGGVITGGLAGKIAAKIAIEAINNEQNDYSFLKKYDIEWKKALYYQLKIMGLFRWLLNRITNKGLDLAFEAVIKNDLTQIIEDKADIDKQAGIILALLKNPSVLSLILKLLSHIKL